MQETQSEPLPPPQQEQTQRQQQPSSKGRRPTPPVPQRQQQSSRGIRTVQTSSVPLLKLWTSDGFPKSKLDDAASITAADPSLAHGEKLPERYLQDVNPDIIGTPLEEIDPFYYKSKTFILITKDNVIERYSSKNACGLFGPLSPLRLSTINILNHWIIWYFLVILILVNYVTRIAEDKINPWISFTSDVLFLSICLLELSLQFVSTGLIMNTFTTLRNPWSWLDLFIILTGLLRIFFHVTIFEVIAAFRTLKLIPIVTPFWNSYKLVEKSMMNMLDILIYAVIVIFGLALVGIQAYDGLLQSKCIEKIDPNAMSSGMNDSEWYNFNADSSHWLIASHEADEYYICGNKTRHCPIDYVCLRGFGSTPNHGYTNFNSFGWACLNIVRLISQDFIDGIYFLIPASNNYHQLLFFFSIFFIGTFVIVSFVFAITYSSIKIEENDNKKSSRAPMSRGYTTEQLRISDDEESESCIGILLGIHDVAKEIMASDYFRGFLIFVVLVNILMLCQDNLEFIQHHPKMHIIVAWIIFGCHFVYVVEFLLNFSQHGCNLYFLSLWNIYEFLMMPVIINYFIFWFIWDEYYLLNAMRVGLILLPIIKLIYRWQGLRFYFLIMWKSLKPFKNRYSSIFVLTMLGTIVFGEVGTVLFKDDYADHLNYFSHGMMPRWNFHDHLHSLLMFFRILCGEWIRGLWDCLLIGDVYSFLYFGLALFISYVLVVSMGMAIIHTTIDQLSIADSKRKRSQIQENGSESNILKALKSRYGSVGQRRSDIRKIGAEAIQMNESRADGARHNDINAAEAQMEEGNKCSRLCKNMQNFITMDTFKWFSAIIVVISCIPLGADDIYASQMTRGWKIVCTVISVKFLVYLVAEMVLKLIVYGFKEFMTTPEHWFDAFIVSERLWVIIMHETYTLTGLGSLRPLMILFRIPNLRNAILVLAKEVQLLQHYFLGSVFIWVAFALFGMQLLDSKFYKCIDSEDVVLHNRIISNKGECLQNNYTWENSEFNFDSVSQSLISLTAIGTFNDWTQIVNDGVDSKLVEEQPAREVHLSMYIYFISFIIVGVFFLQYFLLGVFVYHFKEKELLLDLLTEEQQKVYDREKAKVNNEPITSTRHVHFESDYPHKINSNQQLDIIQILGLLVTNTKFDLLVLGVAVFDTVVCFLYFWIYDYTTRDHILWKCLFWFITGIYIEEMALKLIAWRWSIVNSYQNILDLISVLASILIGIVYGDLSVWGLRVAYRMLLLLNYVPFTMKSSNTQRPVLLQSLSAATPAITNLICLLLVVIGTFALLGLSQFKLVLGDDAPELLNFRTFFNSILVMVHLSFLSGWPSVLRYIGRTTDCQNGTCGNRNAGVVFLFVFMFISFLIMLNVFVVFVLELISQMSPTNNKRDVISASVEVEENEEPRIMPKTNGADNIEESEEEQKRQQSYVVVDEKEDNPEEVKTEES